MTDSIFFQEAKLLAVRKNMTVTIQGVYIGDANASFGESHARSKTRHENLSHGSSKVKSRNRIQYRSKTSVKGSLIYPHQISHRQS